MVPARGYPLETFRVAGFERRMSPQLARSVGIAALAPGGLRAHPPPRPPGRRAGRRRVRLGPDGGGGGGAAASRPC